MSAKKDIERLCNSLQSFRDARIRQRKGQIYERYMIARRTVREMYRDYVPEELPIDVNRVTRDIDIERDLVIDAECDAINDDFKVAVSILRSVADSNPTVYEKVTKKVNESRQGWRQQRSTPPRRRAVPQDALPMSVLAKISTDNQLKVVDILIEAQEGLSFRKVCTKVWQDPSGEDKKGLRMFLRFLRDAGHIKGDDGNTSRMSYVACPSLTTVRKLYEGKK
jgi:hypothetical protein